MYLDWKEQPRDVFAIDIEANDLLPWIKEIYCMCWINLKTGEKGDCVGHEDIRVFFSSNPSAIFVAHFGVGYDFPALLKVLGVRITINQMIDTVVLSELYSPNISGGHGLDAWGERIGEAKLPFKDFSRYTEEMLVYCRQDTLICAKVFVKLIKTLDRINFSEKSIWIQHRFKLILRDQKDNGFYFNISKAYGLHDTISKLEKELEEIVHMQFPPVKTLVAVRNKFKKNGDYTKIYLTDCSRYTVEDNQDGSYSCYEDVSFNLGSPKQRVDKLMELGWVPQDGDPKTKTGNPKPFEKGELAPSLQQFLDDNPEVTGVASIAKWMVLNGRTTMLQTWMDNYNQETGAIHGSLFVADTLRLKHSSPNTANIPAVRTGPDGPLMGDVGQWTYECRDLWEARPGRALVGTDAAGLELRVLAHFLNKAEFTKQVLEGDPHQYNADLVGIERPKAKTVLYAVMYGVSPFNLGPKIGLSKPEGAKIYNAFLDRLQLDEVIKEAQYEQRNGRVALCDGSQVVCPSPHSALNYKFQGSGARIMALASVLLEDYIRTHGLDSRKVGDIHDEFQYDVSIEDSEAHARAAVQCIRRAGEMLKLNIPLDGTSKIGRTWAQTH